MNETKKTLPGADRALAISRSRKALRTEAFSETLSIGGQAIDSERRGSVWGNCVPNKDPPLIDLDVEPGPGHRRHR